MLGGLRVDLSPMTVVMEAMGAPAAAAKTLAVFGGTLRAFGFGAGPELSSGPIEIVFSAEYLTKARAGEIVAVGEFAKLPAEVVLTDTGFEIHVEPKEGFLPVEELTKVADQEHPVAGKLPPLSLALGLGVGFKLKQSTKTNGKAGTTSPSNAAAGPIRARLRVPPPSTPCLHLEIALSLKRDGAELVRSSLNGRLDVSLSALDFLAFYVETTEGKPAPDTLVELALPGEELFESVTDKDGRFAFNGIPRGKILVRLPGCTRLRAEPRTQEKATSTNAQA